MSIVRNSHSASEIHRNRHSQRGNAVTRLQLEVLNLVRQRKLPPPLVARTLAYVSSAIARVYANQAEPGTAAKRAKEVARDVVDGVMKKKVAGFDPLAKPFIEQALRDQAEKANQVTVPESPMRHQWTATDEQGKAIKPLLPGFGAVTLRVPANQDVLAEAPAFSDRDWLRFFDEYERRTPEQVKAAQFWADGPGTFTPPGHWNVIFMEVAKALELGLHDVARGGHLLNSALMDAAVSCWKTKYLYWGERPFQAAQRLGKTFQPELKTPPFPGYTSGHATFSAAAAAVLGGWLDGKDLSQQKLERLRSALMPSAQVLSTRERLEQASNATEMFRALAEEAASSRVWGGIHLAADGNAGLEAGRRIGLNVLKHG